MSHAPHADFAAYRGTRVLVLGASGFLGRFVARALARTEADLHLCVRDPERASSRLASFDVHGASLHAADLGDEAEIARLLGRVEPAVVFDLAGYGVGREEADPSAAELLNALLPERLAKSFCTGRHPAWTGLDVVRAGSAAEYGAADGNLSESTHCRPTTVYGRTKLAGTLALTRACSDTGLRAITARLFTLYGPGERPGRLFPTLIEASRGAAEVRLGAASQQRDFLYAEDAAAGLLRLGLSRARPGEAVNLATGRLTSVREFALAAARLLGIAEQRLRFEALPPRDDEMRHRPVDVARLRELCAWTPFDDVEQGIARALARSSS